MEDGEWVLVKRPTIKDLWRQSSVEDDQNPNPLKLTFTEPAKHWTDAIPIGNGRLGAMVWGGVASETLQLNEDTLWTGNPGNYTNPKAPEALAEVRKLVDSGQYVEATKEAVKLSADPSDVYQLLGDIKLEFDDSHLNYTKETYSRELDLDTATVKVKYSVGDVEFTREHFASTRDQVIVTKISGSKPGLLSFTVYLESKLHHHSETSGKNQIRMGGSCPGKRAPQKVGVNDNPKGIQFSAVLDVLVSDSRGVIQVLDDKKLKVDGSDWAVLLLVAHSSFDGPFTKPSDSKKDPTSDSLSGLSSIRTLTYSDLYARHLDDYQSLFHRVSLQLSKSSKGISRNRIMEKKKLSSSIIDSDFRESDGVSVSTAERVKTSQADEDPSLVELLFQYGRYLLISCSRPGTQISNLQGIWNKDLELAWDGAPHLNVNLQMNYWPSLPCNLKECQEPLFDYMSSLSINGNKTAKVNYEASGWVVHQVSDIWAKTSPDRGEAVWALWPMGGAWLCTHLWEHYTYTMDKAYPLMEGCALFLLDWLIEGHGGYLETNPSTSPQHMFVAPDGKQASVSYSSTMDIAIIKEVFSAFVSTAEAQDFQDPDMHHRHVSHLFGLFPGHTITRDKTPDLCKAADFTLYKRGLYERRVQDGQLHRKLYFEHVFTTVSTHTVWSNICLFWWIQIMRVILREDYTVTCTLHTLLSRLMPTMDFRQQLQKCLSRALLRICTYFQIFPGINGQMVVCKDLKHVAV